MKTSFSKCLKMSFLVIQVHYLPFNAKAIQQISMMLIKSINQSMGILKKEIDETPILMHV